MNYEEKMLGDLLVSAKLISEEQLEEAFKTEQESGRGLESTLLSLGYVQEQDVLQCIGSQFGMEVVNLENISITREIVEKIEEPMVRAYNILPIFLSDNLLTIAISNPFNTNMLDDLKFMLEYEVKTVLCKKEEIEHKIVEYYGLEEGSISNLINKIGEELEFAEDEIAVSDINNLEKMANEAPVVKLLNLILIQAIKDKASDIHLEPFESEFKVRYRVDGALYEMVPPPKHLALAITSRVKVMASLDIAERRLPQDGRIQVNIEGKNIDLRVSTLPTAFGESVVMRVLDRSNISLDFKDLGMPEKLTKRVRGFINKPHGIFVVTGPTGSGKTTTLYACLKELNTIDAKIITTEDPVEYDLDGIMQIPINDAIGLTFSRCLRAILRQDPDRIMVGEIRDIETAEISIQASLTGHLVLSTLHTNDAPGSVTRLIDMGAEPYLLNSTLQAVLAQRLVRKICKECKEDYTPTLEMVTKAGLYVPDLGEKKFYYGKGCKACNNTGYAGRTGIYELLEVTDEIKKLIMKKSTAVSIKHKAIECGMFTLEEDGLNRVLAGITTLEEVSRET